jgi:hypothetical protein
VILEPSDSERFDRERVRDPWILRDGGNYYLFYSGLADDGIWRIGVLTSQDGSTWERYDGEGYLGSIFEPGPPGLWDEKGVTSPSLLKFADAWLMTYRGKGERETGMGIAKKTGGLGVEERFPIGFKAVTLFPNPTRGTLKLTLNHQGPLPLRLKIYDRSGRLVNSLILAKYGSGVIDISPLLTPLSSGLYFLKINGMGVYRLVLLK